MEFKIFDNYFQTDKVSKVAQSYMATVLPALFDDNPTRESKGYFVKDGEVRYDGYDMPYHIHILNGLIPMLFVYEQFLINNSAIDDPNTTKFLKILMLGFTFHDANKMFPNSKDLQTAIYELQNHVKKYQIEAFFEDWETYQSYIYFLALQTENRTEVQANEYAIRQQDHKFMVNVLAKFCHLADALASLSEFDDVEDVAKTIQKHLDGVQSLFKIPVRVSYIKIQPNPYHLLSQTVLQKSRQVLFSNKKIPFFKLQSGIIYFGEPLTANEYKHIIRKSCESDLNPVKLTNIDFQRCTFDFLGSIPFTCNVLQDIIAEQANNCLHLSPNGIDKISNYNDLVEGLTQLIANSNLPIRVKNDKNILRLHFAKDDELTASWHADFIQLVCLYKMQLLNSKANKQWDQDYKLLKTKEFELDAPVVLPSCTWTTSNDIVQFWSNNTNLPDYNTKTLLAILRAYEDIRSEAIEESKDAAMLDIINHFEKPADSSNAMNDGAEGDVIMQFIQQYVAYENANVFDQLLNKAISIPKKNAMCVFTGAPADTVYKEGIAFGLKARGGNNRTVTTLNNKESRISQLFIQENRLRKNEFSQAIDANTMIFQDFYEANLDIQKDLFQKLASRKEKAVVESKNETTVAFEFDNIKGSYNLYNLNFMKIPTTIKDVFSIIYKYLRLTKALGIRTYITGIMSPYTPHFACFYYQNAPRFVQQLGWDNVRLVELESVLQEMRLLWTIGGNINGNILQIAESRQAYFRIYALLDKDGKSKVHNVFNDFITKNRSKFTGMTTIEQLADIALRLDKGTRSGSNETWIIRIGLEHLRRNIKEKRTREDVIEKIAGQFYKNLRQDHWTADKQAAAGEFAAALYDRLFVQEWKQNLPTINREKDWIYQFGYVFSQKCQEFFSAKKAESEKAAN